MEKSDVCDGVCDETAALLCTLGRKLACRQNRNASAGNCRRDRLHRRLRGSPRDQPSVPPTVPMQCTLHSVVSIPTASVQQRPAC